MKEAAVQKYLKFGGCRNDNGHLPTVENDSFTSPAASLKQTAKQEKILLDNKSLTLTTLRLVFFANNGIPGFFHISFSSGNFATNNLGNAFLITVTLCHIMGFEEFSWQDQMVHSAPRWSYQLFLWTFILMYFPIWQDLPLCSDISKTWFAFNLL